jgi:hypothetical protein
MANTRCRNSRTVQQALLNHRWLNDILGNLSPRSLVQCLVLLLMVSTFFRDDSVPDSFGWPCSPSGQYTARSTYKRLCMGPERWEGASCIWRSWAPSQLQCVRLPCLTLKAVDS